MRHRNKIGVAEHATEKFDDGQASYSLIVLLLFCAVASLVVTFSQEYCNLQNSDSLMPVYASLQKLTWYFWGQDRLLNLLPAFTHGISNPEHNLQAQLILRALFAVIAPAMFAFALWPRSWAIAVATTVATILAIVLTFPWPAVTCPGGAPFVQATSLSARYKNRRSV